MKTRQVIFFVGLILFVISLPLSTKIIMEVFHNQKMNEAFIITDVNEGFPPTDSTYQFKDNVIEIEETLKEEYSHLDSTDNIIGISNLSININREEIVQLNEHPIRVGAEGLNRYYGEIAYLLVEDKKNDITRFIVLVKRTKELAKKMPNGDIRGWVTPEKLKYTLYAIDEDGTYTSEDFSYSKRDALQTELLNAGAVFPYRIGYYTDALQAYPSLLFPLIYPFATLIIGFIMVLFFFPYRRLKK
ncbi:hypothetical protein K7887_11320 [Sutcliffiella horikoshii]|uniref:hypothetical protein n=1 Tax=Sutcliffiella horikoshii TaxID=79883 RepID=UPI001CBB8908|nr:hypothetical protein [Sutcliffiella horikoshii]UAL45545.1 hypothetical protein K7887_11320 [Sutcliffiella horikoshii]